VVMTIKEWRKRRNQAGILLSLVMEAPKEKRKEAQRIYREWQKGKITYKQAKKLLIKTTKHTK